MAMDMEEFQEEEDQREEFRKDPGQNVQRPVEQTVTVQGLTHLVMHQRAHVLKKKGALCLNVVSSTMWKKSKQKGKK